MALRPKLSNNKKRKIKMLLADAYSALQEADLEQCVSCCDRIDAILPNHPDAVYLRGVVARECDDGDEAEKYFKQAIALAPERADLLAALAGLYLTLAEYEQAVAVYRQVLDMDPHAVHALVGLAGALVCLNRCDEAITLLEQARKQRPGALDVRMGLFQACHDNGDPEAARGHLQDILKRDPDHAQAHYSMALLDIEAGDLQAGMQSVRKAIAALPDYSDAYSVLADLQRFEHENEDFKAMHELYDRCEDGSFDRMNIAFALAKAHDDLGRAGEDPAHFSRAFELMNEANTIRHQLGRYDEEATLARMQQLIERSSATALADTASGHDARPVFILGMPRSGTTLVEQILAAHPDVCACGENPMLNDALHESGSNDPLEILTWSSEQCSAAATNYLQRLEQRAPDARCFTDKTLGHIEQVASIARCLPGAKIIHVRRNASDNCLSIYKNNITGDQFEYGHNLEELGRYYHKYEQLMAHWRTLVPKQNWIEIEYEALVAEPEAQIRALLEACDLTWNPACLDFRKADNRVLTASMAQVRRPIYQSSVAASEVYRDQLQPLRDALNS